MFLKTPRGLFTPAGTWFRTTTEQLEASYSGVLGRTDLDELIYRSEIWLESHRSLALLIVPVILAMSSAGWALWTGFVVFLGWMLLAPALGNFVMFRIFVWLGWIPIQILVYIVFLSMFGAAGEYDRLLAGVGWFVAMRWRLLDFLLRPIRDRLTARIYLLPVPDQMLRAVIFSEAIRLGIPLDGFPSIAKWLDRESKKEN